MRASSLPRLTAVLLGALIASACSTMAPTYERPDAPVAETLPYANGNDAARLVSWRTVFTDPDLQSLIESALKNNRDLRVAALNVDRARALYRVQRADSLPAIAAAGDYSYRRIGENASTGSTASPTNPSASPLKIEQFSASAGVSAYELDLFGRVRSLNRQALESYFAADETRKAAEIALISEVATAYFRLAADRELLTIATDTFDSQQTSYDLTQRLVDKGVGTDVDVERVRTSIERARADAAVLKAQTAQDEHALRFLVGAEDAPSFEHPKNIVAIDLAREIPVGLPSDVLLERPDVLAAERRLKAANANIGAARAAFFPRILLTASAGTASAELTDLFSAGTGVWSFAPSISIPIFTGGRNRAQLSGANIDRDIAQAEYEGAIQSAFRETADALATRATINDRVEAVENLADASRNTFSLAQLRFENGVDDYFAVLDAQRSDYAARRELVAARLAAATNVIELFRALAGDVQSQSPPN